MSRSDPLNKKCLVVEVGLIEYAKALDLQKKTLQAKKKRWMEEDVLLLLEHPPTITIGRKGSSSEILVDKAKLKKRGISVYQIGRGGKVTYHGPGQLVGYPLLNLTHYGKDLHLYLRNLEEVIIRTLKDFAILAQRRRGLTGVWVENKKIASLGVEVKSWISLHGFALNVNCDLSYFDLIQPCGMQPEVMTSMAIALGSQVKVEEVSSRLVSHFEEIFLTSPQKTTLEELERKINRDYS
jgi:lipoate-protein ligase B